VSRFRVLITITILHFGSRLRPLFFCRGRGRSAASWSRRGTPNPVFRCVPFGHSLARRLGTGVVRHVARRCATTGVVVGGSIGRQYPRWNDRLASRALVGRTLAPPTTRGKPWRSSSSNAPSSLGCRRVAFFVGSDRRRSAMRRRGLVENRLSRDLGIYRCRKGGALRCADHCRHMAAVTTDAYPWRVCGAVMCALGTCASPPSKTLALRPY